MNKKHSWTRQQYDNAYRDMRFFGDRRIDYLFKDNPPEIVKAADYSYQAFAYVAHGWSTDERLMRFHAIKYRALTQRGELPF